MPKKKDEEERERVNRMLESKTFKTWFDEWRRQHAQLDLVYWERVKRILETEGVDAALKYIDTQITVLKSALEQEG